jgi:hypothetical protein
MNRQVQASRWAIQVGILILASQLLFACDTFSEKKHYVTSKSLNAEEQGTASKAFSAALTPLEDMGFRKREIPPLLHDLSANPYTRVEATAECQVLQKQMADLETLLGPDVDTQKVALTAQESYIETGTSMIGDAVVGLVKSQANIIPLRGIVRRVTGAESHEKEVNAAIQAGKLRRAYLRGYADARYAGKCSPHPNLIPVGTEQPVKEVKAASGTEMAAAAK